MIPSDSVRSTVRVLGFFFVVIVTMWLSLKATHDTLYVFFVPMIFVGVGYGGVSNLPDIRVEMVEVLFPIAHISLLALEFASPESIEGFYTVLFLGSGILLGVYVVVIAEMLYERISVGVSEL